MSLMSALNISLRSDLAKQMLKKLETNSDVGAKMKHYDNEKFFEKSTFSFKNFSICCLEEKTCSKTYTKISLSTVKNTHVITFLLTCTF